MEPRDPADLASARPRRVGVLGGHTALARAVVERLADHELDLEVSAASPLEALTDDLELLDARFLADKDLLVITEPAPGLEAFLADAGARILDLGGHLGPGVGGAWWWSHAGARLPRRARLAVGLADPIARVLGALGELGGRRVHIATYESAAVRDKPGLDALSEQARAIFTLKDVAPAPFSGQLAFSVLADLDPDELARPLAAAFDGEPPRLRIRRALVPTFSVEAAALFVDLDAPLAELSARLKRARGVAVRPKRPAALDAVDRDDVLVHLEELASGELAIWLAADRLRAGGPSNAALAIASLCREDPTS